jgi:ribosomal protein S18 acetylase RimI-like enzyme
LEGIKMNDSSKGDGIVFEDYAASDAEEITTLLAEVFPRRDPLALAPGVNPADFALFVRTLLPQAAEEGLTMVARMAGTGEMVGAMLTNDPGRETGEGMETLSEKFGPIASILGELVTTYRAGREPRPGEMLHLYLLGVSDSVAEKGVAQRLVAATVEKGARRGFRVAVAEASNSTSQHIFRKLGFVERNRMSYRDHAFNGQHVFESVAAYGGPILMEKRLAGPSQECRWRGLD